MPPMAASTARHLITTKPDKLVFWNFKTQVISCRKNWPELTILFLIFVQNWSSWTFYIYIYIKKKKNWNNFVKKKLLKFYFSFDLMNLVFPCQLHTHHSLDQNPSRSGAKVEWSSDLFSRPGWFWKQWDKPLKYPWSVPLVDLFSQR
jgi:hypothetical protein